MLRKHPNLCMILAGGIAVLALPPLNVLPLMFLSLAYLMLQIANAKNAKQAFLRGWLWGLGYFGVGFYWINVALTVDWPRFAWLIPLCAVGLPAAVAAYTGLTTAAVYVTANWMKKPRIGTLLLFPLFWTAFEILRGHALSGFPWNVIGAAFTDYDLLFQILSIVGIYGAGFLICAMTSFWLLGREITAHKNSFRTTAIIMLAGTAIYGAIYLQQKPAVDRITNVRIVQPNVSQHEKWDPANRQMNMQKLLSYTAEPSNLVPDLVVWPEASVPYIIAETPPVREAIAFYLPRGATLAAGTIRRDGSGQYFNSIEYMDFRGEIINRYDKFHLVPFGEYVPFGKYVPLPVVTAFSGLGRGQGPMTQKIAGIMVSPLICYEVIFPGEVTHKNDHPQMLLNVTNDGWYGDTIGPYQHLAQARARAVEEGIPLVRSANTGISAVVDRHGRIIKSMPYGEEGMIDAEVNISSVASPPAAGGRFYLWLGLLAAGYAVFVIRMTRA